MGYLDYFDFAGLFYYIKSSLYETYTIFSHNERHEIHEKDYKPPPLPYQSGTPPLKGGELIYSLLKYNGHRVVSSERFTACIDIYYLKFK